MTGNEGSSWGGLSRRGMLKGIAAVGAGLALPSLLSACTSGSPAPSSSTKPVRGGRLRVGLAGASTNLDAHTSFASEPDLGVVWQLYEPLFTYDAASKTFNPALAESLKIEPDQLTWTVTLRRGVEFHNGKTVTSDDAIYSLKRMLDPKFGAAGSSELRLVDGSKLKKLSDTKFQIVTKQPFVDLQYEMSEYSKGIVPVDYDPKKPVGTGAFQFRKWTPGEQIELKRHANYWRAGEPYLDELVLLEFADQTARVNALLSDQVDAIGSVPYNQTTQLKADPSLVVVDSKTGKILPFTMRVDRAPFTDPRVRQAMRLLVDRDQFVAQALSGHGWVANDLYSPYDPFYATDLPQRHQDAEQVKSLLKQAGYENLQLELVTASNGSGWTEAAQVMAQQARMAHVDVRVRQVSPSDFWSGYPNYKFSQTYWVARPFLPQTARTMLPGGENNECHWADPAFTKLIHQAAAEFDDARRKQLVLDAQKILYDRGGYILPAFANTVDAFSQSVGGLKTNVAGFGLDNYGFRHAWLA